MPGAQTTVPVMLDHVANGRLSLARLVDLLCSGPARIFNIAGKGRIAQGYAADFTLVDLKAQREITADWLAYRCGWSPFEGMNVTGWPVGTIIRGNVVMRDGELADAPVGVPVRFMETLG
jgi:dihydroorotase